MDVERSCGRKQVYLTKSHAKADRQVMAAGYGGVACLTPTG